MRAAILILFLLPVPASANGALSAASSPVLAEAIAPPFALPDHLELQRPPALRPDPPPPPPVARALPPHYPRPPARDGNLPRTRWSHIAGHAIWSRVALSALKSHGKPLVETVPADVDQWCPAYPEATTRQRRAFWLGLVSALAKHESTYRASAVGGANQWFGLLQIAPGTARSYRCNALSGESLRLGGPNLSCAVRIMARTVPRDGVIAAKRGRWMGVAADWAPMRASSKRADMQAWLRKQPYCQRVNVIRPRLRPLTIASE
ncbi:transglycosylase SLT domain-containing protein [Sulfitobacter sp. LCG007]